MSLGTLLIRPQGSLAGTMLPTVPVSAVECNAADVPLAVDAPGRTPRANLQRLERTASDGNAALLFRMG